MQFSALKWAQVLTACPVEKNGGNQELPGVVEKSLLHEAEWGSRWGPLLKGLAPGGGRCCGGGKQ